MKPYKLQKWAKIVDDYGNPANTWVLVADIKVSVSNKHDIITNNDISYKVEVPEGLTVFNQFISTEKYRIVGDKTYEVVSYYTTGRWTQLSLKAVS